MYVISANYRDRASPYKWLIRRSGEEPGAARACTDIDARYVRFEESSYAEYGWGCEVVAIAESAVGRGYADLQDPVPPAEVAPDFVRLKFNGLVFATPSREVVAACERLRLTSAGDVLALRPQTTSTVTWLGPERRSA